MKSLFIFGPVSFLVVFLTFGCGENVVCGDGKISGAEVCDGIVLGDETCLTKTGLQEGELVCSEDCLDFVTSNCHTCGDNNTEGPEVCDLQDMSDESCSSQAEHRHGTLACLDDCSGFDTSSCHTCNDGSIEGPEVCDGENLDDQTCSSQTEHDQGQLACGEDCLVFDVSDCHTCGDNLTEGPEVCDLGDLAGESCSSQANHDHGTLECLGDCSGFDTSNCHTCNDGTIEGPEVCDGANVNEETCESQAQHNQGQLACSTDCLTFNVSDCHTCNNGEAEGPEACDGDDLADENCASQANHDHGTLVCNPDCTGFDIADCHTCGNEAIEGPEDCDTDQLGGVSCQSLEYDGGEILCALDCSFDLGDCYDCGAIDPCHGIGCSLNGTCDEDRCVPFCNCDLGYYASTDSLRCIEDGQPDSCQDQTCSGHGRCEIDAEGAAYCICDDNYVPEDNLLCIEFVCSHDYECPVDQVCNIANGDCEDGSACQADYNCPADQYCEPVGKVCKDRSALCELCTINEQCTDPGMGDMCITYPDGDFCGQRCGTAQCPPGYVCDLTAGSGTGPNPGQCRSNTGTCEFISICVEDSDCAANMVCNEVTGNCINKCQVTGCAGGLICHYTGHCGVPCAIDVDCMAYGDELVCCTGPGVPSTFCDDGSDGLCRPDGCELHSECLLTVGDSLGYCDKSTNTCMTGCRAADPLTVNDCIADRKCECVNGTQSCDSFDCCPDPGGDCLCDPGFEDCSQVDVCDNGQCVEIPCYELGTEVACSAHNMCCGFPIDDGYECPTDVTEGECYTAPSEDWCLGCSDVGHPCQTPNLGYGKPGVCLTDSDDNSYCHPACRDTDDCPSGWQCNFAYGQGCEQADHCEPTASCDVIYRGFDENNQVWEVKGCHCLTDDDCPGDINGFNSFCIDSTFCDYTVDPADCWQGKMCKFGRACLSTTGCPYLISGG
jgi:hypothetical protein